MPNQYFTKSRQLIQIGEAIGQGGQATVFDVPDTKLAAKIYHKPSTHLTHQKLIAMVANPPPTKDADGNVALSWPQEILYSADYRLAGFTMPRIDTSNYSPIFHYWNPKMISQLHDVPDDPQQVNRLLKAIGINFLTILNSLHILEYVVGDINERNILAHRTGPIAILDSDSFQVYDQKNNFTHRCQVGREEYTDPNLLTAFGQDCTDGRCPDRKPHRKAYQCVDRMPEHDNFSIAVVLFKLLMNGHHPFDGPEGSYHDKIVNRLFPYDNANLTPPPGLPERWEQLDQHWRDYFKQTFTTDLRYSAEEVLMQILGLGPMVKVELPAPPQPPRPDPSPQPKQLPSVRPPPVNPLPVCPGCNQPRSTELIYCPDEDCAAVLLPGRKNCSRCNCSVPLNANFCPDCGVNLVAPTSA